MFARSSSFVSLVVCASLLGCATPSSSAPPAASTHAASAVENAEPPPSRGFKDKAISVQIVDERSSIPESAALTREVRSVVVDRLRKQGAQVMDEAPEKLVIVLREYQTTYDSNTLVGCVTFAGKYGQAAFLPGETRARRCASDTSSTAETDAALVESVSRAVPSAKDKPGLARAFVGALDELMRTLERRVR